MNHPDLPTSRSRFLLPMLLILGIVIGIAIFSIDAVVAAWVSENIHDGWLWTAHYIGKYGDWPLLMLIGGLAWWLCRWKGWNDWRKIILVMMLCSTVTGATVNLSRLTTGRTRPSADVEQGWYGLKHEEKWIVGRHKFNSFPSGHTATAFGFFSPLLYVRPRLGFLLLAIPVMVALARIGTRSHHPSDVWWAMMVAMLWGWWLSRRFLDMHKRRIA